MAKSEEKNLRKEREDRCIKSISSVSADNNVGNAQNVKIKSGSGKNRQHYASTLSTYANWVTNKQGNMAFEEQLVFGQIT